MNSYDRLEDTVEAVRDNRKGAEQGIAPSQFSLGERYRDGNGVPKDYVQAYKWFNLAAAQGLELAAYNLSELEKIMTPEQIAEGQRLASEFHEARR